MNDSTKIDTFIQCLPYLFENNQQRYLISHFLWEDDDKVQKLIFYLRAYDLVQRMYYVKFKCFPSKETGIYMLHELMSNHKLFKYLSTIVKLGIFPSSFHNFSLTN